MTRPARLRSDEELIETYRVAAIEHRKATDSGDFKVGNLAHDRLAGAYRTLRSRGSASQAKLLALLDDKDIGVRGWVGAHALEFAPDVGEPVLIALATEAGFEGFDAEMTLKEWRAGRLRFPQSI